MARYLTVMAAVVMAALLPHGTDAVESTAVDWKGSDHPNVAFSHHHKADGFLPLHSAIDALYPMKTYNDLENPFLVHTEHYYHHVIGTQLRPTVDGKLDGTSQPTPVEIFVHKEMHTVHDTSRFTLFPMPAGTEVRFLDNEDARDTKIERYMLLTGDDKTNVEMATVADMGATDPKLIVFSVTQMDRKGNFFMRHVMKAEAYPVTALRTREYTIDPKTKKARGRYALAPGATPLTSVDPQTTVLWVLRCLRVDYHDIFNHADLLLDTNYLPESVDEQAMYEKAHGPTDYSLHETDMQMDESAPAQRRMQAQWWNPFDAAREAAEALYRRAIEAYIAAWRIIEEGIRQARLAAERAAKIARDFADALMNIDVKKTMTLISNQYNTKANGDFEQWTFDLGAVKARLQYNWEVGFRFTMSIRSFKLALIEAVFYGAAGAAAEVRVGGNKVSKRWKQLLLRKSFTTIVINIAGVPVFIKPTLRLTAKLDVFFSLDTQWHAIAKAYGRIEGGMRYADGQMDWVKDKVFKFNRAIDPVPKSIRATLSVTPAIEIGIEVQIMYIGGPLVILTPAIELFVGVNTASPNCVIALNADVNIEVSVGAVLDINIEGIKVYGPKQFGPAVVFAIPVPLLRMCMGRNGKFVSVSDDSKKMIVARDHFRPQVTAAQSFNTMDIGTIFEGQMIFNTDTCGLANASGATMSLTVMNVTNTEVMVIMSNSAGAAGQFWTTQTAYRLDFDEIPGATAEVTLTKVDMPSVNYVSTTATPGTSHAVPDLDPSGYEMIGTEPPEITEDNVTFGDYTMANTTADVSLSGETTAPPATTVNLPINGTGPDQVPVPSSPPVPSVLKGRMSPDRLQFAIFSPDGCGTLMLRANASCPNTTCDELPVRATAPPLIVKWNVSGSSQLNAAEGTIFLANGAGLSASRGMISFNSSLTADTVGAPIVYGTSVVYQYAAGGFVSISNATGAATGRLTCAASTVGLALPRGLLNNTATVGKAATVCGTDIVVVQLTDLAVLQRLALPTTATVTSLTFALTTASSTPFVFVALSDGSLIAIGGGSKLWTTTLPAAATSPVAVQPGFAVVGAGSQVIAMNISTGTVAWTVDTPATVNTMNAVRNGVFFSAGTNLALIPVSAVTPPSDFFSVLLSDVIPFDPIVSRTGAWIAYQDASGRIFMYSCDDASATAELDWSFETVVKKTLPMQRRGIHLIAAAGEAVMAIDLKDGSPEWRAAVGEVGDFVSSFAVVSDGVAIATQSGSVGLAYIPEVLTVRAPNEPTSFFQFDVSMQSRTMFRSTTTDDALLVVSQSAISALNVYDGVEMWRNDANIATKKFTGCASELVDGTGYLLTSTMDGTLTSIAVADGAVEESTLPLVVSQCASGKRMGAPAHVIVVGSNNNSEGRVAKVDRHGAVSWQQSLPCPGAFKPLVGDGYIVAFGATCIAGYQADGTLMWTPDEFGDEITVTQQPVVIEGPDGDVGVVVSGTVVNVFDPLYGEVIVQLSTPRHIVLQPVLFTTESEIVVVFTLASNGFLYAFQPFEDNPSMWQIETDNNVKKIVVAHVADGVYFVVAQSDTTLYVMNLDDGSLQWTYSTDATFYDITVTDDAELLLVSSTGVDVMDLSAEGALAGRIRDKTFRQAASSASYLYLMGSNGVAVYPRGFVPVVGLAKGIAGVSAFSSAPAGQTNLSLSVGGDFSDLTPGTGGALSRRALAGNGKKTSNDTIFLRSLRDDVAKMLGVPPSRVNITAYTITRGKVNVTFTVNAAVNSAVVEQKAEGSTAWMSSTKQSMAKMGMQTSSMKVASAGASVSAAPGVVFGTTSTGAPASNVLNSATAGAVAGIVVGVAVFLIIVVAVIVVVAVRSLRRDEPASDSNKEEQMTEKPTNARTEPV